MHLSNYISKWKLETNQDPKKKMICFRAHEKYRNLRTDDEAHEDIYKLWKNGGS